MERLYISAFLLAGTIFTQAAGQKLQTSTPAWRDYIFPPFYLQAQFSHRQRDKNCKPAHQHGETIYFRLSTCRHNFHTGSGTKIANQHTSMERLYISAFLLAGTIFTQAA